MRRLLSNKVLLSVTTSLCLLIIGPLAAQARPAPTGLRRPEHRLLLKAGLRLTHLSYSIDQRTRLFVLPVSFGAEYRLTPHFSLYGQGEADVSVGRRTGRRRGATQLPGSSLGFGVRYYYHHSDSLHARQPFGGYLALEGNAELETALDRRGRGGSTSLTPALYAFWGTQHRWAGHPLLVDLNAGLGLQAPSRYSFERPKTQVWDVVAQLNLRVYFGRQSTVYQRGR